jgi:hypothetical protein
MKYTIYEDPLTHKFALLPLPSQFVEGDKLPIVATDRWFGSRVEAIAALPELLTREEHEPEIGGSDRAPARANGPEFH